MIVNTVQFYLMHEARRRPAARMHNDRCDPRTQGMGVVMKIFSWNVNGIRAVLKKGVFQPFLDGCRPDVVCLQETKAERGQFEIDLPEFHEYWNSAVKKGYSGTAIFSKKEPLSVVNGFPAPESIHKR